MATVGEETFSGWEQHKNLFLSWKKHQEPFSCRKPPKNLFLSCEQQKEPFPELGTAERAFSWAGNCSSEQDGFWAGRIFRSSCFVLADPSPHPSCHLALAEICNPLENVARKEILKAALNHSHWKIIRACSWFSGWLAVESNLKSHSRKNACTCLLLLSNNQELFFKQVWRKRERYGMYQRNFSALQNGKYIKTSSECVHGIHPCLKYCLSQVQLPPKLCFAGWFLKIQNWEPEVSLKSLNYLGYFKTYHCIFMQFVIFPLLQEKHLSFPEVVLNVPLVQQHHCCYSLHIY